MAAGGTYVYPDYFEVRVTCRVYRQYGALFHVVRISQESNSSQNLGIK